MTSDVLPWLEYRWTFDFPVGMFRSVLERLRGTPSRLEDLVPGVSATLTRHERKKWSAQEHVGHLWTVEVLFQTRIGEYLRGEKTLTPADMGNRATAAASYNDRSIGEIVAEFRAARARTLQMLDPLTLEEAERISHHPRLDRPMRLVDLCFFSAEHDDHHLALIRELLR
jgi:uncharacterized damage-inducible protein DinB